MTRKKPADLLAEAEQEARLLREVKRDGTERILRAKLADSDGRYRLLHKQHEQLQRSSEFWNALHAESASDPQWAEFVRRPGGKSTAIVVLSDWHSEERVNANQVNYKNDFNLDVCRLRVWEVVESSLEWLEYARQMARVDELVVALLGDMISGWIHEELVATNFLSPLQASRWVGDLLHDVLHVYIKRANVKHIIVPCCHGNHGRQSPKKTIANSADCSIEWAMYDWLEKCFSSHPKIAFKIEKGIQNYLPVQGRLLRFTHGDYMKFNGGMAGITGPVEKKLMRWAKATRVDLDIFGHFHQSMRHWEWVCNGCLVGWNDYAVSIGADYQEPTQTFMCIDRNRGMWLCEPLFAIGDRERKLFKKVHKREMDTASSTTPVEIAR